ncbi:cytochrome P450 [Saccharothrix sp. MB29]|nr:cytochrome P450 [Saccharothrix sp. MB29]
MSRRTAPLLDETAIVAAQGYTWLPGLRRAAPNGVARTRVLGQRAVGLCGEDATRFFYDEDHVRRETAIPGPVQSTLFGHDAVHTLDGDAHRRRKSLFLSVLTPHAVADLTRSVADAWDAEVASWGSGRHEVLFDAASRVLTRGVCRWAGVPLEDREVARSPRPHLDGRQVRHARPRHWQARRARGRRRRGWPEVVRRRGRLRAGSTGSALEQVARHRDEHGEPLEPRLAAVELLNVVRPTVAVCWFVSFAAHALHRWPAHRQPLASGDTGAARAFTHEIRRFYPFAPFLGGRAVRDLMWRGEPIPKGALVLLDVYGQNHDPATWDDPYAFRPERFADRPIGAFDLIPQGGGDPATGHRCPGEGATVGLLETLVMRLAATDYRVPDQDLAISLRRVPAKVRSGFVVDPV